MTVERFKLATGANITHVPYKSGGALMPDVISGNVDGAMTELATSLEQHKGGQARIIGIAAASRSKLAPDIATLDEQGVKGFRAQSFVGVVAPAKTPPEIIAKLQAAIAAGLKPGSPNAEKFTSDGLRAGHGRADDAGRVRRLHQGRLRGDAGGCEGGWVGREVNSLPRRHTTACSVVGCLPLCRVDRLRSTWHPEGRN